MCNNVEYTLVHFCETEGGHSQRCEWIQKQRRETGRSQRELALLYSLSEALGEDFETLKDPCIADS